MRVRVGVRARAQVWVWVCVWVRGWVRARVRVCLRARLSASFALNKTRACTGSEARCGSPMELRSRALLNQGKDASQASAGFRGADATGPATAPCPSRALMSFQFPSFAVFSFTSRQFPRFGISTSFLLYVSLHVRQFPCISLRFFSFRFISAQLPSFP